MRLRKPPTGEQLAKLDREQQAREAADDLAVLKQAQAAQQKRWDDAAALKESEEREAAEKVEVTRRRERQRAQEREAAWLALRSELQDKLVDANTALATITSETADAPSALAAARSKADEIGAERMVELAQKALIAHEKSPR